MWIMSLERFIRVPYPQTGQYFYCNKCIAFYLKNRGSVAGVIHYQGQKFDLLNKLPSDIKTVLDYGAWASLAAYVAVNSKPDSGARKIMSYYGFNYFANMPVCEPICTAILTCLMILCGLYSGRSFAKAFEWNLLSINFLCTFLILIEYCGKISL